MDSWNIPASVALKWLECGFKRKVVVWCTLFGEAPYEK